MPRKKRLAVPVTMWSALGPIPVRLTSPVHYEDGNPKSGRLMGKYEPSTRTITVDSACAELVQLQTAVHEAVHCWLLDAGLRLGKFEEPVVDVISTAIVAQYHQRTP